MTELLTAAQMRAIEQAAIESDEVTGLELMERAGRGVVEAIFEEWPELAKTDHRAVVLCGPGNNGGDGFVVARLLKEWGWQVEVFLYGDEGKLPADAKVNCERWLALGEIGAAEMLLEALKFPHFDADEPDFDIFVDGVFGTGLARDIPDIIRRIFECLNDGDDPSIRYRVSIDIPSGICADSGRVISNYAGAEAFYSNITVSFHAKKLGHILNDGEEFAEKVSVKDIGLSRDTSREIVQIINHIEKTDKSIDHNKYSHGHAYILSGPSSKTGAARLAARGALRIGAGVVTVASPPDALAEHAAQLTAIMLTPVADAQALSAVLTDERINAICVGPALGLDQDRVEVLAAVLAAKRATVVDADGLTLLAQNPELMALLHDKCVLTPHGGEFARVFPDIAEKLSAPATKGPAYSKVDATRAAAKRAGCVVLFKGADTVIADAQGRCAINSAHYERSALWLATAGSGDVLAGFITGLMARGFDPMHAAETGAWLHVECALKFGPGLIAEDLPEQLPEVFRDLEL